MAQKIFERIAAVRDPHMSPIAKRYCDLQATVAALRTQAFLKDMEIADDELKIVFELTAQYRNEGDPDFMRHGLIIGLHQAGRLEFEIQDDVMFR